MSTSTVALTIEMPSLDASLSWNALESLVVGMSHEVPARALALALDDAQERLLQEACGPRWAPVRGLLAPFACPGCGAREDFARKGKRTRPRKLHTAAGTVELILWHVGCRGCGRNFAPLLVILGLSGKRRTDRLSLDLAELGTQMSFARAGRVDAELAETSATAGEAHNAMAEVAALPTGAHEPEPDHDQPLADEPHEPDEPDADRPEDDQPEDDQPAVAAPGWSPPGWSPPGWPSPGSPSASAGCSCSAWSSWGRPASGSSGSWGSSATGWSSSGSGSWPPVSSAATSAMALWACPAVAAVPASSASTRPARANDICVPSSARSRLSRSVRRLPDSPRITSSGAKLRPQPRHPTCHRISSTVPAAVCSLRGRVRFPLRAKSSRAPHPGHANGASRPRTGAHRGPHASCSSRSCASSRASANARAGTSCDMPTTSDSNAFHDKDASSEGISIVRATVLVDIGGDSSL